MQFVVEIPDECVTMDTCFTEWVQNAGKDFRFNILPKGHGRLVDMSEVIVKLMQYYDRDIERPTPLYRLEQEPRSQKKSEQVDFCQ